MEKKGNWRDFVSGPDEAPQFNMGQYDFQRYNNLLAGIDILSIEVFSKAPNIAGAQYLSEFYEAIFTLFKNIEPLANKQERGRKLVDGYEDKETKKKVAGLKDVFREARALIDNAQINGGNVAEETNEALYEKLQQLHQGVLLLKDLIGIGAPARESVSEHQRIKRSLGIE